MVPNTNITQMILSDKSESF